MNEDITFLLKHRGKSALLDANLLLVYVIGKTDRKLLGRHHHTKQYEEDFELLEMVVDNFRTIMTTPNILTEVSNLGKKNGGPDFFNTFKKVIHVTRVQISRLTNFRTLKTLVAARF